MTRLPDWQTRLTDYLAGAARRPFEEGAHDCALFAADAVRAMTGRDLAAEWRGSYASTRAGLKALARAGYRDHVALAGAHFTAKPVALANPGDLAVVPTPEGDALGVVQGECVYVLGPAGLLLASLTAATQAFEVS